MQGSKFFEQVGKKPPFSRLHPQVGAFFKEYLSHEKVITFQGRRVVNTHFPPYPSRAFEQLVEQFSLVGDSRERRLYSVTIGVTNRCGYRCWHCYNAGRSQQDMPLALLREMAPQFQALGAATVTLSGGEPLLREDLEEIVGAFDDRSCAVLNTTGWGLTEERARRLRDRGLFGMGVSLDTTDPEEHDRLRGKPGAFRAAMEALKIAGRAGLYPYVIALGTRSFLEREHFRSYMRFVQEAGALEVHVLEPNATGRLANRPDVVLSEREREVLLGYQQEVARDDRLPVLSTFLYLESPEAFGCGAGLTHLYVDGSGEVCPCNLVPLSFGNVAREPLQRILAKMGRYFCKPRLSCVGRLLAPHIPDGELPTPPQVSLRICEEALPVAHELPRFFRVRSEARGEVGRDELRSAYDRVWGDYEEFWLTEAGKPIEDLIARIPFGGMKRIFEAGCGTGFATVRLAGRLGASGRVTAVDLSEGMLTEARRRAERMAVSNVQFVAGDALQALTGERAFDLVFSSWVLGYIPLKAFLGAARRALGGEGRLGFVVHKEDSPYEPLEIFHDLIARDPSVLQKRVAFDFPRDMAHVRRAVTGAGLVVEDLWEGQIVFRYKSAAEVLEHLLKSGAGTAFYDAVDPAKRPFLEREFLRILGERHQGQPIIEVVHDYISCIAARP